MTTRIPLHRVKALRLLGALLGLSAALGACTLHDHGNRDRQRARRLPPCVIRSRSTEADRSIVVFVGHARGGLSGVAAHRRHGTGADLGARRHRRDHRRCADRYAERARGGGVVPGNPVGADGRRRALARHHAASLPSGRSANAADDQAELSEDHGGGRPLRPVAGRSRTRSSTMSPTTKTAVLQFRLRHPAQPRGDDRQSGRSRAAATRDARPIRRGATSPSRNTARATPTTTTYPEADKAKLSDTGK